MDNKKLKKSIFFRWVKLIKKDELKITLNKFLMLFLKIFHLYPDKLLKMPEEKRVAPYLEPF